MKFDTFQGNDGQWYWRMGPITGGRKTGDGSEGYATRAGARRAAWNVVKRIRADLVSVDGKRG